MKNSNERIAGDEATAMVTVHTTPEIAFAVFTGEIDRWWRRGVRYRIAGKNRGFVHLEPKLGGRIFEQFDTDQGSTVVETGKITLWEPPSRFVFEWRSVTFVSSEHTEVEVQFQPTKSGTAVTITHRGWSKIRQDHPVRHGKNVVEFVRTMGLWWGDLLVSFRDCCTTI